MTLIFKVIQKIINYYLLSYAKTQAKQLSTIDRSSKLGKYLKLTSPENIQIGSLSQIGDHVTISSRYGNIILGDKIRVADFTIINATKGSIKIGNNSTINSFTILDGYGKGITIGKGVRIAAHTMIISSNHVFENREKYIFQQGLSSKGIIIEDDVWIGAGCKILDGAHIKKGSIIAAGAVVSKIVESYEIVGGIPARKIKNRT